jgi:phosphoribosyl 1,2-cyclic phosphodiesterase
MVEICSLASGSNGNCYYIGNSQEAVIVDAGISYTRLHERMYIAGLNEAKIKAIFVSHEHRDHAGSVRIISKKLSIPAYATFGTYNKIPKRSRPSLYCALQADTTTQIGGINVFTFAKSHDANEPVSFRIEIDGHNIGVMTDIGVADVKVCSEFSKCDAVFLESNYDPQMLADGPYPPILKKRVGSEIGHLSNLQAMALLRDFANPQLYNVILSHISADNNSPEKIMQTFAPFYQKYNISLASRYKCGAVIRLT